AQSEPLRTLTVRSLKDAPYALLTPPSLAPLAPGTALDSTACGAGGRSTALLERWPIAPGHRKLRQGGNQRRWPGLCGTGRAYRRIRQRRHAVERTTDVLPAAV